MRHSSRRARACSTSPAATAATRAASPARRARRRRRPRRRRRSRCIGDVAGIETRQARPRGGGLAARRRALRRDRRHATTCIGRCSRICSQALADDGVLLYETFARGNEAYGRPVESGFPAASRASFCAVARQRRLTVVAFEQGVASTRRARRRRAATGRGRPRPRRGLRRCPAALTPAGRVGRRPRCEWGKIAAFSWLQFHADRQSRRDRDADAAGRRARSSLRSRKLIDFHVANGTAGIVIVGTTGESPTVDVDEHCLLIKTAVDHARGRIPVIAGTGAQLDGRGDRAHRVREEGRRAQRACRSSRTTTSRRRKACTAISARSPKAVDLPLLLYNVPSRTVADLANETIAAPRRRCPASSASRTRRRTSAAAASSSRRLQRGTPRRSRSTAATTSPRCR